jgi:hypothetical protein
MLKSYADCDLLWTFSNWTFHHVQQILEAHMEQLLPRLVPPTPPPEPVRWPFTEDEKASEQTNQRSMKLQMFQY